MSTLMEAESVISEMSFLRDRKILSEDGLVIVVATVDKKRNRVVSGPDIISRGFVYMRESGTMIHEAQQMLSKQMQRKLANSPADIAALKSEIIDVLGHIYMIKQNGNLWYFLLLWKFKLNEHSLYPLRPFAKGVNKAICNSHGLVKQKNGWGSWIRTNE